MAWGRQRNLGLFSGLLRGVSHPYEGSEILTFLFRPFTGVQSQLLHLRSSWKGTTAIFALKLSEKSHEQANLLAIKRLIAT